MEHQRNAGSPVNTGYTILAFRVPEGMQAQASK